MGASAWCTSIAFNSGATINHCAYGQTADKEGLLLSWFTATLDTIKAQGEPRHSVLQLGYDGISHLLISTVNNDASRCTAAIHVQPKMRSIVIICVHISSAV